MKKLVLFDGMAMVYRAYYALNGSNRMNSKGVNTSAVLGFTTTLYDLLKKLQPTHAAVAFDLQKPTFRHEMYAEYKANREAMPEAIQVGLPYIRSCKGKLKNAPAADSAHLPYLRRIALYLIFRYLLKSVYDGEVLGYAKFAAFSVIVISTLYRCKASECVCGFEECADIAKDYSKEVEYSDENMEQLLEILGSEPFLSCDALKDLLRGLF